MQVSDWHKLYGEGWTGLIVPEAFGHPAKYSRALIRHIYQHLVDEGWLEPGATVIDPFAGVALGALHAMKHGLNWVGVELEEKFVDLGQQNIDLWNSRFSQLPGWGRAVILQGDSRRLVEVVGKANGCISSPPFGKAQSGGGISAAMRGEGDYKLTTRLPGNLYQPSEHSTDPANLGNMPEGKLADAVVSSPPYLDYKLGSTPAENPNAEKYAIRKGQPGNDGFKNYGASEGQLANMPEGEFDGVVASPPYAGLGANIKGHGIKGDARVRDDKHYGEAEYGNTDGQLAALPEGEFDGVVSSPPWEQSAETGRARQPMIFKGDPKVGHYSEGQTIKGGGLYGSTTGNIGNATSDTFWSAAKTIVQQVYQSLAPGSPAVWVVKAFVRKGKRVDFPGQWRQMCESVGFETVHIHRAWLVEDRGGQFDLFGKVQENKVERKSFFRRLHEYKASAKMYWEQHVTDRSIRARYLWDSHQQVWESYHYELANPKKDLPLPTLPTRSKITANARVMAYKDADEPWMDIDTRIDHEVVLCQRKPA